MMALKKSWIPDQVRDDNCLELQKTTRLSFPRRRESMNFTLKKKHQNI